MSNSDALRESVETYTEQAIPHADWERFVTRHPKAIGTYNDRQEDGDTDAMSRLAESWEAFERGRRPGPRPAVAKVATTDPRWEALTEILAYRARQDADVVRFRTEELDGTFLDPDAVDDWIQHAADEDGPVTTWVTVPTRDDGTWPATTDEARQTGYGRRQELLAYTVPGDSNTRHVAIRANGRLWKLRAVARRILQQTGWPEAWTVGFILTDIPPPKPVTFGYTTTVSSSTVPTVNTVTLKVNPYAVSPRQLEQAYRKIRADQLGGSRVDPVTPKMAALAVHWEKTQGQAVGQRRVEWNKEHPEWRYMDTSGSFGRDGRAAHRQVTGEGTAR